MTIEIKQLIVRAVARPSTERPVAPVHVDDSPKRDDQARIVAACVKQVLRILERSRER